MWELEERHLQEKHQLLKQQLKDQYFMQRHQLLKRHEKVRPVNQKRIKAWYFLEPLSNCLFPRDGLPGEGADAGLQPAAHRGDEEQAGTGKNPAAQDPAQ